MSVQEKMTAIADAIRGKTGSADALTLDGMAAAIAGLEMGSGAAGGLAYDMGTFIFDADNTGWKEISHNLGEVPDFVLVWTDDYVGVTNPDTTYATALGFVWLNQIMGLKNWYTTSLSGLGTTVHFIQSKGGTEMMVSKPTSGSYVLTPEKMTAEIFTTPSMGSTRYRTGVTYHYFVSKAWWNVGGAANAE